MVLAEATRHAIVGDDAVLGHHGSVADPADVKLLPLVDVDELKEFGHVRAAEVKFAERGDVDDADVLPHIAGLAHGIPVVVGSDPLAGQERRCAVCLVPILEGGATNRFEDPSGQGTQ